MARAAGLRVHALHVHHGLQPAADAWLAALGAQCRRWTRAGLPVTLHHARLQGAPAAGESVEAWARRERYRALAGLAREAGCGLVLLAHHRRDQAETVLLQMLRGGGARATAAMPRAAQRDGIVWARPWIDQPREAIEAYLHRHRLRWIDDPSNADARFARNRLRHGAWPALARTFPDSETALAQSARRMAEAAECCAALAVVDAAAAVTSDGVLDRAAWTSLAPARRANLLRHWLAARTGDGVRSTLVDRLLDELPGARNGARWPMPGGGWLVLHEGRLHPRPPQGGPRPAPAEAEPRDLSRPGRFAEPDWGGAWLVQRSGRGAPPELLSVLTLHARRGGERFQLAAGSMPRGLKKQYQARGVPEWDRDGPLLSSGARLVFAPGLGLDARCIVERADALELRWLAAGDVAGSRQGGD
ncbi:MAG: tRNA lysidine(34) synthetase TilS [Rubrivivax sp.]|nr:tRNA lysidine(34) synthetase TilS [Rubrivivax sp.]